jgi:uncharacterized alpha/beta hydrolase family protein
MGYENSKYINKYTGEEEATFIPNAFQNIRGQFRIGQLKKRTEDNDKLNKQRNQFMQKYACKKCGAPMKWVKGTNIMICENEKCEGVKKKQKDGTISTIPVIMLLNSHGREIAETLFEGS